MISEIARHTFTPGTLVSVDPGQAKPHAYAYWEEGCLVACGFLKNVHFSVERVAIESQFGVGMLKLARAAGNSIGLHFSRHFNDVEWIEPKIWKRAICDPYGVPAGKPKRKSDGYPTARCVEDLLTPEERELREEAYPVAWQRKMDLVDAVGIGLYALERHSMDSKKRRSRKRKRK